MKVLELGSRTPCEFLQPGVLESIKAKLPACFKSQNSIILPTTYYTILAGPTFQSLLRRRSSFQVHLHTRAVEYSIASQLHKLAMSSFNRFQHSCAYTAHRGTPRSRSVDLDPTPSCRDCRPPWCKMCLQFNKAQVEVAIAQNTANEGFHDRDITFSNNLELVTYKAEGKCKRLHKAWHSNVFDRRPLPEGQDCTVAGASCIRINSAGRSWQRRLLSPAN